MNELQRILSKPDLKHDLNAIRERAFHFGLDRRMKGEAPNPGADWFNAEKQLRREDELLALHFARSAISDNL